jgi:hypothetical protein
MGGKIRTEKQEAQRNYMRGYNARDRDIGKIIKVIRQRERKWAADLAWKHARICSRRNSANGCDCGKEIAQRIESDGRN